MKKFYILMAAGALGLIFLISTNRLTSFILTSHFGKPVDKSLAYDSEHPVDPSRTIYYPLSVVPGGIGNQRDFDTLPDQYARSVYNSLGVVNVFPAVLREDRSYMVAYRNSYTGRDRVKRNSIGWQNMSLKTGEHVLFTNVPGVILRSRCGNPMVPASPYQAVPDLPVGGEDTHIGIVEPANMDMATVQQPEPDEPEDFEYPAEGPYSGIQPAMLTQVAAGGGCATSCLGGGFSGLGSFASFGGVAIASGHKHHHHGPEPPPVMPIIPGRPVTPVPEPRQVYCVTGSALVFLGLMRRVNKKAKKSKILERAA